MSKSVRNIAIVAAVTSALGISASAHAAPVANFSFQGQFQMYDPTGALFWNDYGNQTLTGAISMDLGSMGGTAQMQDSTPFFGQYWTAHDIQLSMNPLTFDVNAHMLFDWGVNSNMSVYTQFHLSPSAVNALFNLSNPLTWIMGDQFTVTTNDADGDGIPGNKMVTPPNPFLGFSPAFTGYATFTGLNLLGNIPNNNTPNNNTPATAPVPVPAAAWLFVSGLLGLGGIARRKKAKAA